MSVICDDRHRDKLKVVYASDGIIIHVISFSYSQRSAHPIMCPSSENKKLL